jgi:hypothetical protein
VAKGKAERFEEALQRAAQGETVEGPLAPLVEIARRATVLREPASPPPHRLSLGRQRFLAEAARIRAAKAQRRTARLRMTGVAKLATALIAAVLVFGSVFGAAQAAVDSLPGGPLYGLKLAGEKVRLGLTTAPHARADLSLALAEERLDEIAALAAQRQTIDDATAFRAQAQLMAALETAVQVGDPAASQALSRLENSIQQRQRTLAAILGGLPEAAQAPVQLIVRVMEQVRQEAHLGQGDPAGLRQRLRQSTPLDPAVLPGTSRTVQPANRSHPTLTPRATHTPDAGPSQLTQPTPTPQSIRGPQAPQTPGPGPTGVPQTGPTPQPTQPLGPESTGAPQTGPTPHPTQPANPSNTAHPPGTSDPGPARTSDPTPVPGPGNGGGGPNRP